MTIAPVEKYSYLKPINFLQRRFQEWFNKKNLILFAEFYVEKYDLWKFFYKTIQDAGMISQKQMPYFEIM